MLLIDQNAALESIPALLPDSAEERDKALGLLRDVIGAAGESTPQVRTRLKYVSGLFEQTPPKSNMSEIPALETARRPDLPKAS
jgi:hypothetical protein